MIEDLISASLLDAASASDYLRCFFILLLSGGSLAPCLARQEIPGLSLNVCPLLSCTVMHIAQSFTSTGANKTQ
ncbi:hypothetical protein BC835DRAFT_1390345 [Cytidiella melzeri]|nr:hypothetical protein BC835DRAFT_1390345 [Cytidiella melzeri]